MTAAIQGPMAALLTHRLDSGAVDFEALERNSEFVLAKGLTGVVPCGGTGEYFSLPLGQRREIVERLVPVVRTRGALIAGVGSANLRDSVSLAHHALQAGVDAVLLPPPYFYRYQACDLREYFRRAARAIGGPTILYNLASFVSPIDSDLIAELLQSEPNIIGIKDSSGGLDILQRLTREEIPAVRIQGHDAWLAESLRGGLADGAISGPASAVPEALTALFREVGNERQFSMAADRLSQFLAQHNKFPYPWALKWAAENRGLGRSALPFQLGPERLASKQEFDRWFDSWLANNGPSSSAPAARSR